MKNESGRSLIEVIGVLAITGVLTAGAIATYRGVRNTQLRTNADTQLEQIARNTKLLLEMRGDYTGVSVDYLIKAGALKSATAPLGDDNWSITSSIDGQSFSINLTGLSQGECNYFLVRVPQWASAIIVNGFDGAGNCFSSATNQISFIVK